MDKKHILISGGSGMIGSALSLSLLKQGHFVTIMSRNSQKALDKLSLSASNIKGLQLDKLAAIEHPSELKLNQPPSHFVALSGAGIADKRWSSKRKTVLLSSRIDPTKQVIAWLEQQGLMLETAIIGSAIGFYDYNGLSDPAWTETSQIELNRNNFAQTLCHQIEEIKMDLSPVAKQITALRTGVVLSPNGGALGKMLLPAKLCLNGKIGSGEQAISWIHLDDVVQTIDLILNLNEVKPAYNLVAPNAISNQRLSQTIAKHINRPFQAPVPSLSLKLLLGEAADLLLKGQNVAPNNLIQSGYDFKFADLDSAIKDCLSPA